jgi:site-specific recombinase XerC
MENLLALPGEGFSGQRDRLILQMFYSTGCRAAELVGMNIADINLEQAVSRFWGKAASAGRFSLVQAQKALKGLFADPGGRDT